LILSEAIEKKLLRGNTIVLNQDNKNMKNPFAAGENRALQLDIMSRKDSVGEYGHSYRNSHKHSKKHSHKNGYYGHYYYSQKYFSNSCDGLYFSDSRDCIPPIFWVLPFIPLIPLLFIDFNPEKCTCRGGLLGGTGEGDLCDCFCYCDAKDTELIPVIMDDPPYDVSPDFTSSEDKTCGCVYAKPISNSPTISEASDPSSPTISPFPDSPSSTMSPPQDSSSPTMSPFPDSSSSTMTSLQDSSSPTISPFSDSSSPTMSPLPKSIEVSYSYSTEENTPLNFDTNVDGGKLYTVTSFTQPSHGDLTLNPNDGIFTYTPNGLWTGSDTFIYEMSDNSGIVISATVMITTATANSNPVAVDDTIRIDLNTPVTFDPITNDTDPDMDTVVVTKITNPSPNLGSLTYENGKFTYTPKTNWSGVVSFSYEIEDGNGGKSTAIVTIVVGDATASIDDQFSTILDPSNEIPCNRFSTDANGELFDIDCDDVQATGDASIGIDITLHIPN